jgi:hypothetical protein
MALLMLENPAVLHEVSGLAGEPCGDTYAMVIAALATPDPRASALGVSSEAVVSITLKNVRIRYLPYRCSL